MKKILSLLLVSVLLLLTLSNAFASFPQVSAVTFKDSSGATDSLAPGETITAEVTVGNLGIGESLTFILTLGSDSKIVDSDIMLLTSDSAEESLSAELTMPSDVTGLKLTAMLWNNLSDMAPIVSASLLPGGEEGIKYILSDGEPVSGFSEEVYDYSLSVESDKSDAPYISAPAFDGKTKVDIKTTMSFPGRSEITVASPDSSLKAYSLAYEAPEGILSDNLTSSYSAASELKHNLTNGVKAYGDNENITVENIPDELIGSSYIIPEENYSLADSGANSIWLGADCEWYSLDIKRTAKVIFFSENEIPKLEAEGSGWIKDTALSADAADSSTGEYTELGNAYTKKIITAAETEITIPNPSCDTGEFFIAVAYEYGNVYNSVLYEEQKLSKLRYKGAVTDAESGDTYFDQPVKLTRFDEGASLFKDNTDLSAANINANLLNCDYIITNRIKGSTNEVVKKIYGGQDTVSWYSFDLYKSATVMIFPDTSYGDSMANASTDFIKSELTDGSYFSLYNNVWSNIHSERTAMYSKYIEVPEGESVTVDIPNAPGRKSDVWSHIVLVDYRENPLHKEAASRGIVSEVAYAGPAVDGVQYAVKYNHSLAENNSVYVNNTDITFKNIHSSIAGKAYIITDDVRNTTYNSEIASYWFGGARDWVSFKINKSARIKVITDGDTLKNCGNYGFTKAEDEITYFDAFNSPWNTNLISYTVMYYKDVVVPEGETATVIVPNAPTWTTQTTCKRAHVIIIDFAQ